MCKRSHYCRDKSGENNIYALTRFVDNISAYATSDTANRQTKSEWIRFTNNVGV